jgi:hypothetical protein
MALRPVAALLQVRRALHRQEGACRLWGWTAWHCTAACAASKPLGGKLGRCGCWQQQRQPTGAQVSGKAAHAVLMLIGRQLSAYCCMSDCGHLQDTAVCLP